MKVTRLVHSCILVEDERANILIDPGDFTWTEKLGLIKAINNLDYVLITHKHPDHCSLDLLKHLLERMPNLPIISNQEVVEALSKEGIKASAIAPEFVETKNLKHARLWEGMPQLENTVFTIWKELSHFGDNRELDQVHFGRIVAFPIIAPWGSLVDAIDRLMNNKPEIVIPIHDWHLSTAGRVWYQKRMVDALEPKGIKVLQMSDTASIDI